MTIVNEALAAYEESHAAYTTEVVTTFEGTRENRVRHDCPCELCVNARAALAVATQDLGMQQGSTSGETPTD